MRFECWQTKQAWEVRAFAGATEIASLTLLPVVGHIFVHNVVSVWSPTTLKMCREVIGYIKERSKALGFTHIITTNIISTDLPKREKYWRLVVFTLFTNMTYNGTQYRVAAMEI